MLMCSQKIKTPCVGLCSTVFGDLVCRGCKRFHHEIVGWNGYSETEKQSVLLRLEHVLERVTQGLVDVFDEPLLIDKLAQRNIGLRPGQSVYYLAYHVIWRGAQTIKNIEDYGIRLAPDLRGMPLIDVRTLLDKEFFILSEMHYQRIPIGER
ncbi:DUF1289 domain-containing protein [Pseudomonas weihenstephanensis]